MRQLVITPKFRRAYRRVAKRDRVVQRRIDDVLRQMQVDVFAPALATHKLGGALLGLWACSCGYDCRVIFSLETDDESGREVILLLDIGTHDEVY
ncbi:MAG: type II toxin-antitoxin system YafQ family toxin [Ardenticatenaceae bacterium]|nr:type II toxin-antitoxin system YafQ family toxin [Ardenticatenaceae bacterium]HBY95257.1 type II toxin-antitoxin system mRNA interferase toxin, RelE/StbE family [Chloroflexota bacterium]